MMLDRLGKSWPATGSSNNSNRTYLSHSGMVASFFSNAGSNNNSLIRGMGGESH